MTIRQTTPIERDPARLDEVLPWYLNGTLAESDRQWVEQMLAAEEAGATRDLQGQLDFDRLLASSFEQKVAEVPADIGWARLMQQVRADAAPQLSGEAAAYQGTPGIAKSPARSATRTSWLQQLALSIVPAMSPRLGLAMAVLVCAQTIAIGVLLSGRDVDGSDTVEYRSAAGRKPVPAIRAFLNETITEKVLRDALSANGASIVEGPNRLGEYWIVTGNAEPEAVARSMRESGVIANYVIDYRQDR